ncbi:hypothetical protein ANO11243_080550 [Dothideomycetidae sp. 11243]|nr:hypothetical protein ANO11243_080550 [fungal sp. No.11243]
MGWGGVSLSSPDFGAGLVSITGGAVALASYFVAGMSDTKSLGFWATMIPEVGYQDPQVYLTYTDTASQTETAVCNYTDTTILAASTTVGSILCPVANTAFGPGSATFSFTAGTDTYAFLVGQPTVTSDYGTKDVTANVPGKTVYITTDVSTTYDGTVTTTKTTTLTGALPASACSSSASITPAQMGSSSTSTTSVALASSSTSTKAKPNKKTTSARTHSHTVQVSPTPNACSNNEVVQTLAANSVIAQHLCGDLRSGKRVNSPPCFPIWTDAKLVHACSCYEAQLDHLKIYERGEGDHMFPDYAPLTQYNNSATKTLYDATVTETDTTTVTKSSTISYVDGGNSTVDAGTTVTVDQRTPASTCAGASTTPGPKKRRSESCVASLQLQAAYLYTELADPEAFCRYYLATPRSSSPLAGVSASVLRETCSCMASQCHFKPALKEGGTAPVALGYHACNERYAATIKTAFAHSEAFCSYWDTSRRRALSPIQGLCAADICAGCQCITKKHAGKRHLAGVAQLS